jgi:hypothetical protein
VENIIVGYRFDLRKNDLTPEAVPNPSVGKEHVFRAWRLKGGSDEPVTIRESVAELGQSQGDSDE